MIPRSLKLITRRLPLLLLAIITAGYLLCWMSWRNGSVIMWRAKGQSLHTCRNILDILGWNAEDSTKWPEKFELNTLGRFTM